MWRLKEITATNLFAIRQMIYTINQGVTTLIFGNNLDNDSQKSNGSGKSALIEAIAIGISGSPLRRVKNDEIINDNSDECCIRLTFDNDSSEEVFIVERFFYRGATSAVRCSVFQNRNSEEEFVAQSSVDEYNHYILDKLGITKDELFNNFILSKHKYRDFLSSSDREKKDIINGFSNGVIVDRAIELLEQDVLPLKEKAGELNLEFASCEGRIELLCDQLEKERASLSKNKENRENEITQLQNSISEKKEAVCRNEERITELKEVQETQTGVENILKEYEIQEATAEDCITRINKLLFPYETTLSDWASIIAGKKKSLSVTQQRVAVIETQVGEFTGEYESEVEKEKKLKDDYEAFLIQKKERKTKCDSEMNRLNILIRELEKEISLLSSRFGENDRKIQEIETKLAGMITCPKCDHAFLYSEGAFDMEEAKKTLQEFSSTQHTITETIQKKKTELLQNNDAIRILEKEKRGLEREDSEWLEKLSEQNKRVLSFSSQLRGIKNQIQELCETQASGEKEIANIRKKIFSEAFDILDELYHSREKAINRIDEEIGTLNRSISTMNKRIHELKESTGNELIDSLSGFLKQANQKSASILHEKSEIDRQVCLLETQISRFAEFKSYLANTKIEALSQITNEFLSEIGSDILIRFSGYTFLKSGKVKEKISISLLRDGIDCGSYGKFSEGEKARVNLANILAMQKLINLNAPEGKGLDLLVLDEILESVDEDGLSSMFEALNKIKITALVVSHGNVAESYPYKLIINKRHGHSYLN